MNTYKSSKIYIIRFYNKKDKHIYIGSTICNLNSRFSNHKNNKTSISNYINKKYKNDWNCCYIEKYLDFPCKNKKALIKKEYQIINKFAKEKKFKVLNIIGNKYRNICP